MFLANRTKQQRQFHHVCLNRCIISAVFQTRFRNFPWVQHGALHHSAELIGMNDDCGLGAWSEEVGIYVFNNGSKNSQPGYLFPASASSSTISRERCWWKFIYTHFHRHWKQITNTFGGLRNCARGSTRQTASSRMLSGSWLSKAAPTQCKCSKSSDLLRKRGSVLRMRLKEAHNRWSWPPCKWIRWPYF